VVEAAVADQVASGDPRDRAAREAVVAALRDRQSLLVLDNCEHVVETCAALAVDILEACPSVRVMATSREPLGVTGEVVWRVPSLSLPASDDLSGASAGEAVLLFVARARAVRPTFELTEENTAAV